MAWLIHNFDGAMIFISSQPLMYIYIYVCMYNIYIYTFMTTPKVLYSMLFPVEKWETKAHSTYNYIISLNIMHSSSIALSLVTSP